MNKKLQGTYENIGKALVHGVRSRIAGAIVSCLPVKKHVIEKVMKVVSKEVASLRPKQTRRCYEKQEKGDLENLTWNMFVVIGVIELLFSIPSF